MISIRVSDQNYSEIKLRCAEQGASNVSEFVRAATVHALGMPGPPSYPVFLKLQLTAIERQLHRLHAQVAALAEHAGIVFEPPE